MLEYLNEIEAQLLIWLPTVGSVILSVVVPFISKWISNKFFNKQAKEISELKQDVKEMKTQLTAVTTENISLKKKLNETLTKVDHVYREDAEA